MPRWAQAHIHAKQDQAGPAVKPKGGRKQLEIQVDLQVLGNQGLYIEKVASIDREVQSQNDAK